MPTDFSLPVFVPTTITVAGTPYLVPVFQTGKAVKVKLAADPFTEYSGVEEGTTGVYKFTNIPDGKYHKTVDGVQSGTFGVTNGRFIADEDMSQYAKIAGGNTFSGTQIMTTLNATNAYFIKPYLDASSPWYTEGPEFNNSLVNKSWVLAQLAAIVSVPYQESTNYVRCIPNGIIETHKVYTILKSATASFASPSATNQCQVFIPGTGALSQFVVAQPGTLRDNVHIRGAGKHINLVLSDGPSLAKNVTFQDLTIYLGANDYAVARELSTMKFINCDIYAYRDTTFNNCGLYFGTRVIHGNTYKAYLKGTTRVEGGGFNNEPDVTLLSGGETPFMYVFSHTSMPADPSTGIPSEE